MQKKFKVLRFIGTIWKVLAWIKLILGLLAAIGILLIGVLGGGIFEQAGQQVGLDTTGMPLAAGIVGGVAGFVVVSIAAVVAFFVLYAVGELIYLALAVEENTRSASAGDGWMDAAAASVRSPRAAGVPSRAGLPTATGVRATSGRLSAAPCAHASAVFGISAFVGDGADTALGRICRAPGRPLMTDTAPAFWPGRRRMRVPLTAVLR